MSSGPSFVTDADLDRLVDGEFSPTEQRQVLIRVEAETNGWRRLALAFVEGQALKQVCPGLLTAGPIQATAPQATGTVSRRDWRRGLERLAAIAAVAAAYFIGLSAHPSVAEPRSGADVQTAAKPVDTTPPAVDRMQVVFPEGPGEWSEPVELPVVDGNDARAQIWLSQQSVLPVALRNALRETGRRVSEERRWMQVELADGRPGYVPVSDLIVSADDPSRYP